MLETTAASVDKSIRASLLLLESSFFPSLRGGPEALAVFDHEITQFYEEVRQSEPYLKEETRLSIYSFVQMSSAVIPGLIDLDLTGEKIKLELQEGIDKVLDEALLTLSLDDTPFPEPETSPPYIQSAHAWLLNNLHNPYPSKQTRITFATETKTPQKDIDAWFTDIRKRIGWNSLRKKHFSTRKDMIAAATRFFKPSSTQLDTRTDPEDVAPLDQDFAVLEDTAKNLYSRRFSTSPLANGLNAVKDVTLETNPAAQVDSLARQISSQQIEPLSPCSSLEFVSPSPLTTFSSPSPPPSPSQPSSQGRKRRQSTFDSDPSIEAQPHKRMRIDVSVNPRPLSPLPSTRSHAIQHSPPLLDSSPSPISTNPISISETSRKRKRQSDSDSDQGQTKRVHYIPSSPSNSLTEPLPSGSSNFVDLNQWIKSLSGEGIDLGHSIPEPVYETCSPTAAVEIDFYRYASSSPSSSVSSLGPSTPPDYNSSDSPSASHQSLPWAELPLLTKVQGYDGSANITSELLSTNWSEEGLLFDLDSSGILDADFPSQNWDLGLIPATSADDYFIPQIRQDVVGKSIQPWTNEEPAAPISFPGLSNQLSPLTSFSDNSDNIPLPQVFQRPSKGAKIRYLQTLLNEVQNVRFDLAL